MTGGQSAPLVTVITATYNVSAVLRLALESLLNQDFADFEAWVVGDACTDDSEAVVASFGDDRLRWSNLERNSGSQSGPNNEGIRLARGRYIAYLNSDDLWFPSHLSGLVSFIEETKADFVHSLSATVGPQGVISWTGPPRDQAAYAKRAVPPSTWLHRRDVVDHGGLWRDPKRLSCAPDFDFALRLHRSGKTFRHYPRLTVLYFPSHWFRIYAHRGVPPQLGYWQALKKDPVEVERQILLEVGMALDRTLRSVLDLPSWTVFGRAVRRLRQELLDAYGRERWPLSAVLHGRYQRRRRALLLAKGLPYQVPKNEGREY